MARCCDVTPETAQRARFAMARCCDVYPRDGAMAARGENFSSRPMVGELTLLSIGGPLLAGAGGSVDERALALGRPAREPGAHARGLRAHAVALLEVHIIVNTLGHTKKRVDCSRW
ncbi:hypothetical protein T492DRAFT_1042560 [Pavlovales sp. CCMP2436]|nr:hypothetical protein T492DRAFT_1042560 [Pavlovales sp. CCMP2436]